MTDRHFLHNENKKPSLCIKVLLASFKSVTSKISLKCSQNSTCFKPKQNKTCQIVKISLHSNNLDFTHKSECS